MSGYQEVKVETEQGTNGILQPKVITFGQKRYPVKRIIASQRDVVHKYGVGYMFVVEIGMQQRRIFLPAATKRWLVEKKPDNQVNLKPGGCHCCADLLELYKQPSGRNK